MEQSHHLLLQSIDKYPSRPSVHILLLPYPPHSTATTTSSFSVSCKQIFSLLLSEMAQQKEAAAADEQQRRR